MTEIIFILFGTSVLIFVLWIFCCCWWLTDKETLAERIIKITKQFGKMKWFVFYAILILSVYFGSIFRMFQIEMGANKNLKNRIAHWEQKYNEEIINCEKRRTQDLQGWQERYDKEIAQKEKVFKEHPRMRKYFK